MNIAPDGEYIDEYMKRLERCQAKSLLEAKIGNYKFYNDAIITLINEKGWVADHVRSKIIYRISEIIQCKNIFVPT